MEANVIIGLLILTVTVVLLVLDVPRIDILAIES
jgi:hypothetical protein